VIDMSDARPRTGAPPVWKRVAAQGRATAQAYLGRMNLDGLGVARNEPNGIRLLRASAAQNNPIGQSALADSYRLGRGILENPTEARRLYRLAAEAGYAPAQYELGLYLMQDFQRDQLTNNRPEVRLEALRWFRAAAEQDHLAALEEVSMTTRWMGHAATNLTDRERLYEDALRYTRRAAALGSGRAMAELGTAYNEGQGVARNVEAAITHYRSAANAGYGFARVLLGHVYLERGSGAADYAEARRLFEATSDAHQAALGLGQIYYLGRGVQRDYRRASAYYLQAIRASGQPNYAYYQLATMYRLGGNNLQRNRVSAFVWSLMAAETGFGWLSAQDTHSSLYHSDRDWNRLNENQRSQAMAEACGLRDSYIGAIRPRIYMTCPGDQPSSASQVRYRL